MQLRADVVVGLQAGDEAKGKVTHHLCRHGEYTHVLRFNGGCNAGHTIYHEGNKFVTHHIPAGVFFGIKSIIGAGCVLNIDQFFRELRSLKDGGVDPSGLVYVSGNTHIITDEHVAEDKTESKLGTTKRGNGPAYRDKYSRTGLRASDVDILQPYIIDLYEEFYKSDEPVKILCEGAQGFELDIDWGDYPYVTSSHCTVAGAMLNGLHPKSIGKVWGVGKMYQTYVGTKDFEPNVDEFKKIREYGEEYGATTGRPRQCNWIDLDKLSMAVNVNGVTDLVLNKVDVMRRLGIWKLITSGQVVEFKTENDMKQYIKDSMAADINIHFSETKDRI
jgi:adenylosuccinate synthase